MNIGKIPSFSIEKPDMFKTAFSGGVHKTRLIPETEGPTFKNTLAQNIEAINGVMSKPDALMHEAMTTGTVDVHDVMIANAKAELAVTITSQIATKVVQAYDKILQIQI